MVTKSKKAGEREEKKGRVKVNSLKLNRETVKNLTRAKQNRSREG